MANSTLASLRAKLKNEIKIDRLGKVWSDEEHNDAIREAIQEIEYKGNYKWQENNKNTSFTTISDQQEYPLASDFIAMDLVKFEDSPIISSNFLELNKLYATQPPGTPIYYYIYGNNLGFTPIPTTNIETIEYFYRGELTLPTTDTDLSPLKPAFDRAIVLQAAYSLLLGLADGRNAQKAFLKGRRFKEEMAKLINTFLLPDRNQIQYKSTYIPRVQSISARTSRFANI